jgi:methyl-galactoside transport system permease protein
MFMENTINTTVSNDPKIAEFRAKFRELRRPGIFLLEESKEAINDIKKNKVISVEEKSAFIIDKENKIIEAKESIKETKEEINSLVKDATKYTKKVGVYNEKLVNQKARDEKIKIRDEYIARVASIQTTYQNRFDEIKEKYSSKDSSKEDLVIELSEVKNGKKAALHDERAAYLTKMQNCKDEANDVYLTRRNAIKDIRNGHESILESVEGWWKNKIYSFDIKKFLLNNALYITILLIYIICIIAAPVTGKGNLLSIPSVLQILEQSSTSMFYALGVAGLILLAGTDLSIGRMIALGSVTTAVILHDGPNVNTFFGLAPMDFTSVPMALRVLMALGLSIILCTIFSALAGFYTAKFKMHPFITTLSTQLLIYGFLYFSTTGTPTGGVESGIKDMIGGRWDLGAFYFPKLIVYAIIAIIVVWFIWNKTKFGKNMYAVGGNKEAAAVSGISVFWTTLGVFIMAGILYGFGSFFESFRSNSSAGTGQGWELDAIAACVVGGISFNGGIGKIRGAVLGVIIFTGLTYCLSFLNIDTNLQFVFKGIIIMAACALDSVKYLKKK